MQLFLKSRILVLFHLVHNRALVDMSTKAWYESGLAPLMSLLVLVYFSVIKFISTRTEEPNVCGVKMKYHRVYEGAGESVCHDLPGAPH